MSPSVLYPLRFEPIYQYRLWGGRRLAGLLDAPLPGDGPIGEAWVLSDRDDHPSRVADGPLKGRTISQLLEQFPQQVMGKLAGRFRRFPLLLKFLDAREMLSVQVHPADTHTDLLPAGETGKTEAWVVLEAGPESRIYAGLKPGTTAGRSAAGAHEREVADHLACFTPKPGDAVFLPAGTVHALGGDVVVFEVQREQRRDVSPVRLEPRRREDRQHRARSRSIRRLPASTLESVRAVWWRPWWRRRRPWNASDSFTVSTSGCRACAENRRFPLARRECRRVLVCIEGAGQVEHGGATYAVGKGDVLLLPAVTRSLHFQPRGAVKRAGNRRYR